MMYIIYLGRYKHFISFKIYHAWILKISCICGFTYFTILRKFSTITSSNIHFVPFLLLGGEDYMYIKNLILSHNLGCSVFVLSQFFFSLCVLVWVINVENFSTSLILLSAILGLLMSWSKCSSSLLPQSLFLHFLLIFFLWFPCLCWNVPYYSIWSIFFTWGFSMLISYFQISV